MSSWIGKLKSLIKSVNGNALRQPMRATFRPALEFLESRRVPAVTWKGSLNDASWDTNGNWEGNLKPGANDDVVIGTVAAGFTLPHLTGDATVLTVSVTQGGSLSVTGAKLTVTGNVDIAAGAGMNLYEATLETGFGVAKSGVGVVDLFKSKIIGDVTIDSGSLFARGGSDTIQGSLSNDGEIKMLIVPTTLWVSGDYSETIFAQVHVQMTETEISCLGVAGKADLRGRLFVEPGNPSDNLKRSYVPFIHGDELTGTFKDADGRQDNPKWTVKGKIFLPVYDGNDFYLGACPSIAN